jgi:hypothetical protein
VKAAFPQASVEWWAMDSLDEHRVGLKPIVRKVWVFDGRRPVPRSPRSTTTLSGAPSLATSIPPRAAPSGISAPPSLSSSSAWAWRPLRGGWERGRRSTSCSSWIAPARQTGHTSPQLRVPDHIHLLFLPPVSPELQPAEHLWPLSDTALINRPFASIDELEDAQAERCVALQARPDLVRSTTLFPWWPRRIKKRQGPRRI